jgi:hypothetical protein
MGAIQRVAGTLPLAFDPDYSGDVPALVELEN